MGKSIRYSLKIVTLAASLFWLGLAACAANAYTIPKTSINGMRILVACPGQADFFDGKSSRIDWAGFTERDLLVFALTDRDLNLISVPPKGGITKQDAEQVIRMSNCRDVDKYVLIGKDGGVKRRWIGELHIEDLFQTIDAMPMRQFEMRTRGRN